MKAQLDPSLPCQCQVNEIGMNIKSSDEVVEKNVRVPGPCYKMYQHALAQRSPALVMSVLKEKRQGEALSAWQG